MRAAYALLLASLSACVAALDTPDELDIHCASRGECPAGWDCLESIGRCLLPGATCTEDHDGRIQASADGNTCMLEDGESGVCIQAGCQASRCGDGVVDLVRTELCDDGAANSDMLANTCRTDCSPARCGDGVLDTGEECDDGNAEERDACLESCRRNVCGDSGAICSGGQVCSGGVCRDACSDTIPCADDRLCDTGVCVAKIPPQVQLPPDVLSYFAGAPPVTITPSVVLGPQSDSVIVSWHWVVVPDAFKLGDPPDGPSLVFTPDVVGYYALEVSATHRGGTSSNTLVWRVIADSVVGIAGRTGLPDVLVRIGTDGSELSLLPDPHGTQLAASFVPEQGLRSAEEEAVVFVAKRLFGKGDLQLASFPAYDPDLTKPDAKSCGDAGEVWAVDAVGNGACCSIGSSGHLRTDGKCCPLGFHDDPSGSCLVTHPRSTSAVVATARVAEETQHFLAEPVLVGPSGQCDWDDIPPEPITLANYEVKLCGFEIFRLSSADDGSRVGYVLLRRIQGNFAASLGIALVEHTTTGADPIEPINGGLPPLDWVIEAQNIPDLELPSMDYVRLAHNASGARLAVLVGPTPLEGGDGSMPSPFTNYQIKIYDTVSRNVVSPPGLFAMRVSWRAALLLLPDERVVLSPDGRTVWLSAAGGVAPFSALWEGPLRSDYEPLPEAYRSALACAPLCAGAYAPPNFNDCASDLCCECLLASNETDPVAACEAVVASGKSGVSISHFDGLARNGSGTLLVAAKSTYFVQAGSCSEIFDYAETEDFVHEIVVHEVSSGNETRYDFNALTGTPSVSVRRLPHVAFVANDTQLAVTMEGATPLLWVFNRDGSRPRQVLPATIERFRQQANAEPDCAQLSDADAGLVLLALLVRMRRRYAREPVA